MADPNASCNFRLNAGFAFISIRILFVRDFPFAKGLVVAQLGATINDASTKYIYYSSSASTMPSKADRNAYPPDKKKKKPS